MKIAFTSALAICLSASSAFSFWPFDDLLKKERLETELHPNLAWAWGRLASAAIQNEMWSDAEIASKKEIQLGASESGYRHLGRFYEHKGDLEMALMCFKRSNSFDDVDKISRRLGNPSGGREFLMTEIQILKNRKYLDSKELERLGDYYSRAGMRDDAILYYEKAVADSRYDDVKKSAGKKLSSLQGERITEGIRSGKSLEELGLVSKPSSRPLATPYPTLTPLPKFDNSIPENPYIPSK